MKALRIADWPRYERADSKKCVTMQWVAVPINHDGIGYLEIIGRPDGLRIIGGWLLILQVAARCPERGLLVSDGGRILGAREIALKTRASQDEIQSALTVLIEAGWISEEDISGSYPEAIRKPSRLQDSTVQDNTRQNTYAPDVPSDAADRAGPDFVLKNGEHQRLTKGQIERLAADHPGIDVDLQLSRAAAWCVANPTKRKTERGLLRFVQRWLSRVSPTTTPDDVPSAEMEAEWLAISKGDE